MESVGEKGDDRSKKKERRKERKEGGAIVVRPSAGWDTQERLGA